MKTTPKDFKHMTMAELRLYINGCHDGRMYGRDFEEACMELNHREGR